MDGDVESRQSAHFRAAALSVQGKRISNEDQHLILCNFPIGGYTAGLFAVLDGHGGPMVAILAAKQLANNLLKEAGEWSTPAERASSVERAFVQIDVELSQKQLAVNCGSTCVLAVVWRDEKSWHALFANIGDSRGILMRTDKGEILGETVDHKPNFPSESDRIHDAGGRVTGGGFAGPARVDGDLSTSRAFGDFRLKRDCSRSLSEQKVSPLPDVSEFDCAIGDVVVLACDGAFDVLSSKDVTSIVSAEINHPNLSTGDPESAVQNVVQRSLRCGSRDNVTCVVAQIVDGEEMCNELTAL